MNIKIQTYSDSIVQNLSPGDVFKPKNSPSVYIVAHQCTNLNFSGTPCFRIFSCGKTDFTITAYEPTAEVILLGRMVLENEN